LIDQINSLKNEAIIVYLVGKYWISFSIKQWFKETIGGVYGQPQKGCSSTCPSIL